MSKISFVLLIVALVAVVSLASPTTFSSMSYVANLRVHPFEEMPLPQYSMLDGATVSIEYGFNPGYDQLLLDYTGDFDITSTFSKQTGILYLSGTAPISEYSAAIQSVVFVTSAADGANRVVTFTYGQNTTYATSTEHFYRFVVGNSAPWSQAADDCASRSYMGMQGYLATITSDREMTEVIGRTFFFLHGHARLPCNDHLRSRNDGSHWPHSAKTWLGASPNATGAWSWITGPEGQENDGKGRVFWVGEDLYAGGFAANAFSFDNWYAFNPVNGNNATYGIGMPPTYENVAYMAVAGPDDGIQAWVCEFGGMDSAAIAATTWSYTGSMTLQFDCSLFTTTTDCADHSTQGCGWVSGACSINDCSRYLLQSSCEGDWRCDWFVNGEVGVCSNTECAQYANQATCVADPSCYYKNMQCLVASCRNLASCMCSSMDGCTPVGRLCFSDQSIGCNNMDIVYLVDGTMNMSQAFERYPNGFVGVTQAIATADLSMTSTAASAGATSGNKGSRVGVVMFSSTSPITSPASIGSAGRLTGLNSELLADVQYLQRTFTASATSRSVGPALRTALNMLTASDRQRIIIIISSAFISDAAAIQADTTSTGILARLSQSSTTVLGVTLRPTEPETTDSIASAKSLAMITSKTISTTMTNFYDQVVYGVCSNEALTLGALLPVKSIPICSSHVTQMDCVLDATCSWDNAARACSPTACLSLCTSSTCASQSNCGWDSNSSSCVQTCALSKTSASCGLKSQSCAWDTTNHYCASNPCTSNPTEDSCIADSYGCTFSNGLCSIPQCQASDIASCVSSVATGGVCTFSSTGTCFFSPCQTTNVTRCQLHPECWWTSGKCALNPCGQKYQTEMTCQSDRNCGWNISVSPAVCGLATCSGLNFNADPQGSCRLSPTCYWQPKAENGYQDMCVVKPCYSNLRSCDCAGQDGCVWTNNTCKDSTFVQCSPMDVVFLVESTTSMTEPFGRHPNGFSGIVEAIRSWGASVPMSPTSTGTGFRLAIVGYGSATRALQPADGAPLYGSNFTNNATLWSGPNLILDNFANNQPLYGDNSGSDVSIFYGLRAAATLFENSNAPGRQKILMIFGHAAITDGDNAAVVEIMQTLQSNNVQVFTNVVRRFSVITPAEDTAASYLRPLATDPVQTHYSFSTIDDLQSSILESFCDPSTTIGTALGISRDGTLPCNWLTGSGECSVQGSCYWNSTALPTCPLAGQCPNLGCVALPAALAAQFECKHCTYTGGAFSCDRSQNYAAAAGVCLKTPCSANCATSSCSGSCAWDAASLRCQRSMCVQTTAADCNMDLGCVWNGITGVCQKSVCGWTRTSTGCQGIVDSRFIQLCSWNTAVSPAVCTQARCVALYQNRALCASFPTQCTYDTVGDTCAEKLCQYTDAELCSSDSGCYWNPYQRLAGQFGTCTARQQGCVVSDFSSYSPCTANCGANSVKVRSRAIVQFPAAGGTSCAQAAAAMGTSTNPGVMAQSTSCSNTTNWPTSCSSYCSQYGSRVTACINDISCQWITGCVPRNVSGCASLATQAACSASDMCSWDTTLLFCEDSPQACRFTTSSQCSGITGCMWRTGSNSNLMATSLGLESYLVNPGQAPIHPFPTLSINSNELVYGGAVTIENGFQLGNDVLTMTYPTNITTTWIPQAGMLKLTGMASASEYGFVIKAVQFQTSSLASGSRNITWNLGNGTLFSLSTSHYYQYNARSGVTWDVAAQICASSSFYGMTGYLATIMSGAENNLVSTKLSGTGWLGGSSDGNSWTWNGGPEAATSFWLGSSLAQGGAAVPGTYANWDPLRGEPAVLSNGTTRTRVYLSANGYWDAMVSDWTGCEGFTCEFGGLPTDSVVANFSLSGAVVIGIAGCLPQTQCIYHANQALCVADSACTWSGYSCVVGCGTRSTATECGQNTQCAWNVTILPPLCDLDPCKPYSADSCTSQSQCNWNGTLCVLKTGCGQYSIDLCNNFAACQFVNNTCVPKRCPSITSSTGCAAVPTCTYSSFTGCTSACRYGSSDDCLADSACQWAAGTTTATPFYSGGSPMLPFATGTQSPNTNNGYIDGITVRISAGFQQGSDVLSVSATNKNRFSYIASYSSLSGVLQLVVAAGSMISPLQAYTFLTTAVQFSTTGSTLVTRKISYVLSIRAANVNATVFKVLSTRGIQSISDASAACNATTLFGLRGRLAVVDKQTINVALNQIGAQGIFAATSTGNGLWYWPGSSTPFWSGDGATGVAVGSAFAAWPFQEPQSDMTFASIGPGGMWFSSAPTQKTFSAICSFGADPNEVFVGGAVYGAVILTPQGCFPQPCAGLSSTTCELQTGCQWSGTTQSCTKESWCSVNTDATVCGTLSGCFWDYTASACKRLPADSCQPITNPQLCATVTGCSWSNSLQQNNRSWGACRKTGCTLFPTQTSCSSDSTCRWYTPLSSTTSICVSRLCGYTTATDCRSDVNCAWQTSTAAQGAFSCLVSPCNAISSANCGSTTGCMYDSTAEMCVSRPCSAATMTACLADPSCLFQGGQCSQPSCSGTTVATCDPTKCYFTYDPPACTAAQCFSYQSETDCEPTGQNSVCRWGTDASACRQATWLELNSPNGTIQDTCVQQIEPSLTWLYIVLVIIFILIALIAYRLFLAFARGLNFLSSTRNNQRFKVHKQYAEELFDESRERADRDADYRNPALNDL
ncbi:membrane-associated protein, putative [Bodo saltans]|uniref:Membrane-associated protein, putative n=1 Tax=Bodo saltans TaxID=75058 RepID=A0A0S4KFJ3_BODSA|nr:membrane-associated protein, putative [Bodo saltans]|eukprot:CUI14460.1 membrane-associated protein, putative [Bodo saltans]